MNALLRLVGWLLALALVAMPVVAVLNGWVGARQWPLTRLRATGEFQHVDPAQLRAALLPHARRGFFAVDLEAAQASVAKLPWVEQAEVRKRWPDVLEVHVIEHRAFARWGKDRLLSEHGRLFEPRGAAIPAGLPQLGGPVTRVDEVVALYNESREMFARIGVSVHTVELDARGSWRVGITGQPVAPATEVVVGRSEARARLSRFVRLLPQLLAQPTQQLVRADLRYTNGFALSWAPLPAPADAPPSQGQS